MRDTNGEVMSQPIRPCVYTVRVSGSDSNHGSFVSDILELNATSIVGKESAHSDCLYSREYLVQVTGTAQDHETFTTEIGDTQGATIAKTRAPPRVDTTTGAIVNTNSASQSPADSGHNSVFVVIDESPDQPHSVRSVFESQTAAANYAGDPADRPDGLIIERHVVRSNPEA